VNVASSDVHLEQVFVIWLDLVTRASLGIAARYVLYKFTFLFRKVY
jgi:hypothetical protein